MPTKDRLRDFIAAVESGDHVGAIERFYHDDASMQENQNPPHVGRLNLMERERQALAKFKMKTHPAKHALLDGDLVVINWIFEMTDEEGRMKRLEELSIQEWRGDKVYREQFYYDPQQLKTFITPS
ncbi:nuclear transport factor 2 family protein [Terrarubrum flagellatum]|uniref:nuclear transport factor 2 family protein n=1 Tax=Terrirubrum flagellatum TaxID=2895980 RepID=UPI0031453D71